MNILNTILEVQVEIEEELYLHIRFIAGIILMLGLIIFLVNSAIRTANYTKRGVANIITGAILAVIFTISYFVDKSTGFYYNSFYYFIFIGISLFYGLVIGLTFIKRGKSAFHRFVNKPVVYTVKEKNLYLYTVYNYQNYVYIHKETNSGTIVKMKGDQFIDDLINEMTIKDKVKLEDEIVRPAGTVIVKGKKDTEYRCFLIKLQEEPYLEQFYRVDKYDLLQWEMDTFDKRIYMTLLLGEPFSYEIDEKK